MNILKYKLLFRLSIRPYTKSLPVATTIILRIGKIVSSSTRIKIRILYVLENLNLKKTEEGISE